MEDSIVLRQRNRCLASLPLYTHSGDPATWIIVGGIPINGTRRIGALATRCIQLQCGYKVLELDSKRKDASAHWATSISGSLMGSCDAKDPTSDSDSPP
eukprot:4500517-Amphidinium_carterae.1